MTKHRIEKTVFLVAVIFVVGCEKKQTETDQPSPTMAKSAPAQTQTATKESEQPKAVMPELSTPADPDEACGQVIVVAWKGAAHASEEITRDKTQAQAKAREADRKYKASVHNAILDVLISSGLSSAAT